MNSKTEYIIKPLEKANSIIEEYFSKWNQIGKKTETTIYENPKNDEVAIVSETIDPDFNYGTSVLSITVKDKKTMLGLVSKLIEKTDVEIINDSH